ncbi:MAG TPA: ATP-binding protein [Acidobacteriota bacterium]|nr:ATP-binding protein [Acidobacteriota bacterium]
MGSPTPRQRWPWLPLLVAVGVAALTLVAWQSALRGERERILKLIDAEADSVAAHVRTRLEEARDGLDRTTVRWIGLTRLSETMAQVESAVLLRTPAVDRVLWLTPEAKLLWSIDASGSESTPPVEGWVIEHAAALLPGRGLSAVRMMAISEGPGGDPVLPVRVPVVLEAGAAGVMICIYGAEAFARAATVGLGNDYALAIGSSAAHFFVRDGDPNGSMAEWVRGRAVDFQGVELVIDVWPTPPTLASLRSALPTTVLIGGLAFAMLLGGAVRLGQAEGLRTKQAEMMTEVEREADARVRAEDALEQRARALERSNADLVRFAHMISHDLREPLNVVDMHLQLLSEQNLEGLPERHLKPARRASARMASMLEGLLRYAKVGGSEQVEDVDTNEVVRTALANLEATIHNSGAKIEVGPMPLIRGNPDHLALLFQNLIGNAIRHRGEVEPHITVAGEQQSSHWLFRVRDNGPGITSEQAAQIFGLFTSGGGSAGSGIGLAICRRVVESHGGRIWVQSPPGPGATFVFTWPLEPVTSSSGHSPQPSSER